MIPYIPAQQVSAAPRFVVFHISLIAFGVKLAILRALVKLIIVKKEKQKEKNIKPRRIIYSYSADGKRGTYDIFAGTEYDDVIFPLIVNFTLKLLSA